MLAACGDDVTGPIDRAVDTEIVAEFDWALAREPGFIALGWQLKAPDPDERRHKPSTFDEPNWSTPGSGSITVQDGPFSPSGVATIRFTARCEPGTDVVGHHVDMYGFKASKGHGLQDPYGGCTPVVPQLTCTNSVQRHIVSAPAGDRRCAVDELVEIDIDLRLDWSHAREPGFEAPRWTLLEREPHPEQYGMRWTPVAAGTFSEDGAAEVRFRTFCEPTSDSYTNQRIEVIGHFGAYRETMANPECRLDTYNFRCTSEPQIRTEFYGAPFQELPAACTPPKTDPSE